MAADITVWGIPTLVASIVGGSVAWLLNYLGMKNIKQLESTLKREEEAYRLHHSPRVTTAIKLWRAYCEFERVVGAAVSPDGQATEEAERRKNLVIKAWGALTEVADEAEVLLDEHTVRTFNGLFNLCDAAYRAVWNARTIGDPARHIAAVEAARNTMLQAREHHVEVVRVLRKAIWQAQPEASPEEAIEAIVRSRS